jgi:squalene synthase HpnD
MNDTTQSQAAGSSFYTAMRLLPPAEREAMFAIYAFCRKVDDIADDPGPTKAERRAALEAWRADLAALYNGRTAILAPELNEPIRRFALRQDDFLAIIDGMQMDVDADIRAPDFETLDLYCDRVASAVGRLSVAIFGMEHTAGHDLAHHLGRALQFTNILRDVDEDADAGRLYLPREALENAGVRSREPVEVIADPAVDAACHWLAAKAHEHYRHADMIMQARPAGRLRAPRLMSAVYGEILKTMERVGWAAPRRRVRLGRLTLIWILARRGLAR